MRGRLCLVIILLCLAPATALRAQAQDSLWTELSRTCRFVPAPSAAQHRALRTAAICISTPGMTAEPVSGSSFLFDEDGFFLSRVEYDGAEGCIVFRRDASDAPMVIRFASPDEDPFRLTPETQLYVVPADTIHASLDKSGATDPANHGCIRKYVYITRNSDYFGLLDFSRNGQHDIRDGVLYVTETVKEGLLAHNRYNYGNFLWGAAAHELHISLFMTVIGANVQNFFCSPSGRWHLDTKDDQLSIRAGYHWVE